MQSVRTQAHPLRKTQHTRNEQWLTRVRPAYLWPKARRNAYFDTHAMNKNRGTKWDWRTGTDIPWLLETVRRGSPALWRWHWAVGAFILDRRGEKPWSYGSRMRCPGLVPPEDGQFVVITDYSALLHALQGHSAGRSARLNRELT